MNSYHNFAKFSFKILICLSLLTGVVGFALAEETYVFERMWPTLQQPWYFVYPTDMEFDDKGFLYIVNSIRKKIQKITKDGQLVTEWEQPFTSFPRGIATDEEGNFYTVGGGIFKWTPEGKLISNWSISPSDAYSLNVPYGIIVDKNGYIYITGRGYGSHIPCIVKFDPNGQFIKKYEELGDPVHLDIDKDGTIYIADYDLGIVKLDTNLSLIEVWSGSGYQGVKIDKEGRVYTANRSKSKIEIFAVTGELIDSYGGRGSKLGSFLDPIAIDIDKDGIIYVSEMGNQRIQRFMPYPINESMDKWGSTGPETGFFFYPHGVDIDSESNIYIVDKDNHRIQIFNQNGMFVSEWASKGHDNGNFYYPYAITIGQDAIYTADFGDINLSTLEGAPISIFDLSKNFITSFGSLGESDGGFSEPFGIAIDSNGYIYISDSSLHRIQKFTATGAFVKKWGSEGHDQGQFHHPGKIAFDSTDNLYVKDSNNVQVFDTDGNFIRSWNTDGGSCIDIDSHDLVYCCERNSINKYSKYGDLICSWGTYGYSPGQFGNHLLGISVNSEGKVVVVDQGNNRVQVFKRVDHSNKSKAIIVAGGGPFPGNDLWTATQMSANFAYRTLTYQGFTKETIYYITSDTNIDLDNNGELDDVDADATNANLQHAITSWAADTESLIVYLVDHGGTGIFRMNGTETLSVSDLDLWLDSVQTTMPDRVIVNYDACESGSFLSALLPPSGKERIVITSTSPGESAYFMTQGSVSFSNFFWTHIFNGLNIKEAFELAKTAIQNATHFQNPLIDANGNGTANQPEDYALAQGVFIGNGTTIHGDAPIIGGVSEDQIISETASADLSAYSVTDDDGIARVWAIIRTPDYNQGVSNNPVHDLPSINLMPVGEDQYSGTYNKFNIAGTYQIAIYARDRIGNTSIPRLTTVNVENPLRRRAIILIGGSQTDNLWPTLEKNGTLAYESLKFQGYTDDDIYFMSPVTFSAGVDGLATLNNLNYATETWAQSSTQDVVLYLTGNGGYESFTLNESENLTATGLDISLNNLQNNISGKVTVIYDACQSGSFLPLLNPSEGKERILISSTTDQQPAYFLSQGDISFSKFFWRRVLNGASLHDSYVHARKAIEYISKYKYDGKITAQIDDNGNGISNEKLDGQLSRYYRIGAGIMLAGDDPLIGSISPEQALNGQTSANIWADKVTTTGAIDKVWAVIKPPEFDPDNPSNPVTNLPTLELKPIGNSRYECAFSSFYTAGVYEIAIFAIDMDGNISIPLETKVIQEADIPIGNINGDIGVDLTDALIVLKVLAGIDTSGMIRGDYDASGVDVNGDGKVGIEEAIFIFQRISWIK